jgi:hypothetical protein
MPPLRSGSAPARAERRKDTEGKKKHKHARHGGRRKGKNQDKKKAKTTMTKLA